MQSISNGIFPRCQATVLYIGVKELIKVLYSLFIPNMTPIFAKDIKICQNFPGSHLKNAAFLFAVTFLRTNGMLALCLCF
jgi:hypothetical protein